jgi:3-hydroxyacyl-[acyl-carrier-protein] dehydratase
MDGEKMETKYSIQEIMARLPHRFPMLLIDKILEIEKGKRIKALKNVTINEPFFQGHFPKKPVMPGVLILEAMAQAGAFLIFESSLQQKGELIYIMSMDNVKFRQTVQPGDQLVSEVEILKARTKVIKMRGAVFVNNKKVAEAEFLASLGVKK